VVIENRAGGGTTIGMEHVAKSPPDGHTLMRSIVRDRSISSDIVAYLVPS
jgi:tripartite-type tricarboxylate transporter receptor subunit TctC